MSTNPNLTRLLTVLAKSTDVIKHHNSKSGKRSGVYACQVVDVSDPLNFGRVIVELPDGNSSGWILRATADVPRILDTVLVCYTTDTDAGFYLGVVRPTADAVVVPLAGETEAVVEADWTHPRIGSDLYDEFNPPTPSDITNP